MVEEWERQPGETAKAFAAFCVYRDQAPSQRSLSRVAQSLGKSKALMDRWSSQNRWVLRAAAWDNEMDRQRRLAAQEEMIEIARRQAQEARAQAQALVVPAVKFLAKIRALAASADESVRDPMAQWPLEVLLDFAVKSARVLPLLMQAEREAIGMPQKLALTDVTGLNTVSLGVEREGLSDEQLASVLRVLIDAGAFDARLEEAADAEAE